MKVNVDDILFIYEKQVSINTKNKRKVYNFERNKIENIYDIKYIVDFPVSILEKKDKTTRLLNTINSEVTRDNVIMNITYSNYLNNKESIESMIKDGYKFSVILDDKYDYQEKSKIWLSIFSYIILDKDTPFDCEKEKIIIKK